MGLLKGRFYASKPDGEVEWGGGVGLGNVGGWWG